MRYTAGLEGITLRAEDGFKYVLVGVSENGKVWPLYNEHKQPWTEYLAGLHNAYPTLSFAAARADGAERELDAIDEITLSRKALGRFSTRAEAVRFACDEAERNEGRAEKAEAEAGRLRAWLTEIYALFPGGAAGEALAIAKRALNGEPHK